MAGESAKEVARRHREKAEQLQRPAEVWDRGAEGEAETARALAALPPEEWTVLHVRWPGRRHANVDHVAIGPPGVFVIDSKAWTGRITVGDEVLRQNGRAREMAVVGAAEAAIAVSVATGSVDPRLVKPVLCFVREEQLVGWTRDVLVCSTANVVTMLRSRPAVLTPAQRGIAALELGAVLDPAGSGAVPAGRRPAASRQAAVPRPRREPAAPGRTTARPARARRRRRADATKALVALAFGMVLLAVPGAREAVAGWLTQLLTG